jgi:hypothetical protein
MKLNEASNEMDGDSYALLYGELCDVICRFDLEIPDDDPHMHTSEYARTLSTKIMKRLEQVNFISLPETEKYF